MRPRHHPAAPPPPPRGSFASDAAGDTADDQPAASLAAVDYARQAGAGAMISRGGVAVRLADGGSAWSTAAGVYWVDPSDVGVGIGKIPADPTMLTADVLRGHPAVFVRGPMKVHALASQQADSALPAINLAIPLTPVEVWTVDAPPDGSRWCFVVDGQAFRVDINHLGMNLRRPADIWNAIIVGGIEQPRPADLGMTQLVGSVPPLVWRTRGRFTRLSFLEYARFVEPLFAGGPPAVTNIYAAPVPP